MKKYLHDAQHEFDHNQVVTKQLERMFDGKDKNDRDNFDSTDIIDYLDTEYPDQSFLYSDGNFTVTLTKGWCVHYLKEFLTEVQSAYVPMHLVTDNLCNEIVALVFNAQNRWGNMHHEYYVEMYEFFVAGRENEYPEFVALYNIGPNEFCSQLEDKRLQFETPKAAAKTASQQLITAAEINVIVGSRTK